MKKKRIHKNRKSYKSIDFYYLQSNSSSHIFLSFYDKTYTICSIFFLQVSYFLIFSIFFFSSKNSIYMTLNINFFDMNII